MTIKQDNKSLIGRTNHVLSIISQLNIGYIKYSILIKEGQINYLPLFLARLSELWDTFRPLCNASEIKSLGFDDEFELLSVNSLQLLRDLKREKDLNKRSSITDDLWALWHRALDLKHRVELEAKRKKLSLLEEESINKKLGGSM